MKLIICKKSGCQSTAEPGKDYCKRHASMQPKVKKEQKIYTFRGKSSEYHSLYNSRHWRKISKHFLECFPVCFVCGAKATIADHIIPHRGDVELFYNEGNLQPMCWKCHSRKTLEENNFFK